MVLVPLGTRTVLVQVWEVRLGAVRLLLLDTDVDQNAPWYRELSARLGIAAGTRLLTLADVHGADGMFVTNARIGVVPVRRVGEHGIPMSPVVARLAAHVESLDA